MKQQMLNANLIKKYHQDLVFNYSEYPTKDHWKFEFKNDELILERITSLARG